MTYQLTEEDAVQIEQTAKYTLMFEKQGVSLEESYLRDSMGVTRLFHNFVVIYGLDQAIVLLEAVRDALHEITGFEELHDAYLLAVEVQRGIEEV